MQKVGHDQEGSTNKCPEMTTMVYFVNYANLGVRKEIEI